MVKCCVKNCDNYSGKVGISPDIRFHKFPNDIDRFDVWRNAAGDRSLAPKSSNYMCSVHFDNSAIHLQDILLDVPPKKRRLADKAVPTLFLPASTSSVLTDRSNRQSTRAKKRMIDEVLQDYSNKENQAKKDKFIEKSAQTKYEINDLWSILQHQTNYLLS